VENYVGRRFSKVSDFSVGDIPVSNFSVGNLAIFHIPHLRKGYEQNFYFDIHETTQLPTTKAKSSGQDPNLNVRSQVQKFFPKPNPAGVITPASDLDP